MNVLFLDQFNQLGGAQQCLLDLIENLPSDETFAAIPGTGPLSDALRKRGVLVYDLPELEYSNGQKNFADLMRFPFDALRIAPWIRSIVDVHGIDLVYVNGPRLLPPAAMVSKKLVFHAHSYLDKWYASALARCCLCWRDGKVIASSRFVARALPAGRVRVIYNGVREMAFRPPTGPPFRIGMVGRIAPEKGQLDFVRTAAILTSRGVQAEYRIHGAPLFSDSSYMRRVQELSSGLPITFPGWTDDIPKVFAELDLLIVPSSPIDATPRVIMESFSAGVPVIAYPSGGIPELIENGVTGVLTKSLPEAIEELLSDPARMHSIALAARRAWEERFTVQRYVRQVQELLATLPAGNKVPQPSRAVTQL